MEQEKIKKIIRLASLVGFDLQKLADMIRQQTLEEAIVKIKERGLHLGYANNIIDELQALKDK